MGSLARAFRQTAAQPEDWPLVGGGVGEGAGKSMRKGGKGSSDPMTYGASQPQGKKRFKN